ncbi:MAG TPA: hypothetical protein VFG94_08745 [Acidimicrobiales bacterium]|nr:hypothetical protein [Acidimicrobiales bacterium]
MGEQAPIPIESRVTRELEAGEAGTGARGTGTSLGRVVHEPGAWPRFAALVAIAALVAGVSAWALLDDDPAPAGDDEAASDPSAPADDPQAATRVEFAEAMLRFGEVHSFAYRGSVRAATSRPFGAGTSRVGDLAIEGAVLLQPALARVVAADGRGKAEETLTSGTTVWTRTAASADTLRAVPWRARPTSLDAGSTLDMQVVARLITTAGDPRGEAPDAVGRRVIRATLPARGDGGGNVLPLAGADVLLSLDDAGDIAHIVLTWPPRDPRFVLDVELFAHNRPQDIAPPDRGPGALRGTVPVEALAADGIRPLELGRVPAGWRLTGAWVGPQGVPSAGCSALNLVYANPDAGSGDYLWLQFTSQRCRVVFDLASDPQPLSVGSFQGSVAESSSGTTGALFDGTMGIQFETDLPVDDVTTLLASLRPFDPEA